MLCKKCGLVQDEKNTECLKCGVIFEKLFLNEYIHLSSNNINKIKTINNEFKNNINNYKLIYKCTKDELFKLAVKNLKNESESKLLINLINNKLKLKTEIFSLKSSVLLSLTVLFIIIFIYLCLK